MKSVLWAWMVLFGVVVFMGATSIKPSTVAGILKVFLTDPTTGAYVQIDDSTSSLQTIEYEHVRKN